MAAIAAGLAAFGAGQAFHGPTLVVDGDTLMVGATRVRIWGVDAPEGLQSCKDGAGRAYACGDLARDELKSLIGGEIVTCEPMDHDPYGRVVARCQARGQDLGTGMVRSGWALDYAEFSHGAYAEEESGARNSRRGIWAGSFERPSVWRAKARTTVAPPSARTADAGPVARGCRLKGNINARGERIFHAPGQEHYDDTRISEARGERWFCSAAEAEAAGWRPARR